MSAMRHWQPLPLGHLSSFPGPWNLVPALPWIKATPAMRQALLGQKAVLARVGEHPPVLLLRLPRNRARLGSQRFCLEQVPGSKAWVLALQLEQSPAPELPALPAGVVELSWGEGGWPELHWGEFYLGCACSPWARDWAWAWAPTGGPVCLRIFLPSSRAEIAAWVEEQAPGLWVSAGVSDFRSKLSADSRMQIRDGFLGLSRGFLKPGWEQVEADHDLLLALCQGPLGELEFDLFDGDYYSIVASGDSAASLQGYLHARAGCGRKHRWNQFVKLPPVDARDQPGSGLFERLGQAFARHCSTEEQLKQALAELSPARGPRHLTIWVSPESWDSSLFSRLSAAQPRILFTWQSDPQPPCKSVTYDHGN